MRCMYVCMYCIDVSMDAATHQLLIVPLFVPQVHHSVCSKSKYTCCLVSFISWLDHQVHGLQCIMRSTCVHFRGKLQRGTAAVRGNFHRWFAGFGQLNTTHFPHHCQEMIHLTNRYVFQFLSLFTVLTFVPLRLMVVLTTTGVTFQH